MIRRCPEQRGGAIPDRFPAKKRRSHADRFFWSLFSSQVKSDDYSRVSSECGGGPYEHCRSCHHRFIHGILLGLSRLAWRNLVRFMVISRPKHAIERRPLMAARNAHFIFKVLKISIWRVFATQCIILAFQGGHKSPSGRNLHFIALMPYHFYGGKDILGITIASIFTRSDITQTRCGLRANDLFLRGFLQKITLRNERPLIPI